MEMHYKYTALYTRAQFQTNTQRCETYTCKCIGITDNQTQSANMLPAVSWPTNCLIDVHVYYAAVTCHHIKLEPVCVI